MPKPVPNSTPKNIKAAAIQLEAVVGDVATNLGRLEVMIKEAVSQGAKLIAVPEFCTSRLPMSVSAAKAVLPTDNLVVDLFKGLAAKYQCWIGGSMLVYEARSEEHTSELQSRPHLVCRLLLEKKKKKKKYVIMY